MVCIHRFGIVALLLISTESAFALGLGAVQVKSALGQPLNVVIPLLTDPSSTLDSSCFALVSPDHDSGVPALTKAKLVLQQGGNSPFLRLTTGYAINDPAVAFAIESRCIGIVRREYVVLVDMVAPVDAPAIVPPSVGSVQKTPVKRRLLTTLKPAKSHNLRNPQFAPVATVPASNTLRLSTELQWLPGEHTLTAEQLSDLKRMRGKLSIDAGGDATEVDNLQDDIVATQKQLAQAKQELAQLRSQIVKTNRSNAPSGISTPVHAPASAFSWGIFAWLLGLGLALAGTVYFFTRRRQLPDLSQAAYQDEPVLLTPSSAPSARVSATNAAPVADVTGQHEMQDDFTMDALPGHAVLAAQMDGGDGTDSLSVTSLMRVTEEAEVFLELGYPERAIKVLTDDIAEHPRNRPAVWIMLLGIYRQQENRVAFDETIAAFSARFNLVPPTWDDIATSAVEGEGLFSIPHVLAKIASLWPGHECHEYLSELLYDNRQGTRQGFRLDVYRDIIWLKEVLSVLSKPETQIAEDVAANDVLDWDL